MNTDAVAERRFPPYGNRKTIYWVAFASLALVASLSFWLFSRFTVDDAFITWRYGKNIINNGVWGYNPVGFDLTQAYTNPIYAALSIIPHYLDVDVVLFFKMVSLITLSVFGFWYSRRTNMGIFVVLLYAIPATFIHAFSGLETFLYVCLVTALFIFLIEDKFWESIVCTLFLFMTRPESWVLLGIVPLFYLLPKSVDGKEFFKEPFRVIQRALDFKGYRVKGALLAGIFLFVPLAIYFYFHKQYFGHMLPNTFYIKSDGNFSLQSFVYFSLMAVPFVGLLVANKVRAFLVAALFFGAVILSYSTSSLAMNYIDRFAFHIISPAYLVLVYVAANILHGKIYVSGSSTFKNAHIFECKNIALFVAVVWIAVFGVKNLSASSLVHIANYYPRAIDAHAELGKAIRKDSLSRGVDSMSFGDAGMTAYHSGITSLDNIGLGSSMVAHEGLTDDTLDSYNPEIVVFHSRPDSIRLGAHNQDTIYSWVINKGYNQICQVYWKPNYTLNVYSKHELDNVKSVCKSSELVNKSGDKEYFFKHGMIPPWAFWKS